MLPNVTLQSLSEDSSLEAALPMIQTNTRHHTVRSRDIDRRNVDSCNNQSSAVSSITSSVQAVERSGSKSKRASFLLVDEQEILQVANAEDFIRKLNCPRDSLIKVISIFGNTGEGKSHTLNHTLFNGIEVFHTSTAQSSCTIGIWAAYDSKHNCIVIDTEGLLGASSNSNQRTRLLLKIMAISDVVIYRTRAERLHNDLVQFLGDASRAYIAHFTPELNAASERCGLSGPLSSLGPAVVIFHETVHTEILQMIDKYSPEDQIKQRFVTLGCTFEAFCAIHYLGIRTLNNSTDFSKLRKLIKSLIENSSIRSSREPSIVYQSLKVLNDKFCGNIEKSLPSTFPDQYFTCSVTCLSCGVRCSKSVNHKKDGVEHTASSRCRYQHQHNNNVFTCKACYEQGQEVIVEPKSSSTEDSLFMGLAKYAWSGYVLECPHCGIIYRSRQYWYGNRDPVDTVVRTEIRHVWPGSDLKPSSPNTARLVLDNVNSSFNTICNASAGPAKMISSWMADRIAPDYWVPNHEITHCGICRNMFSVTDTKHHCRACGDGFCEDCCNNFKPVPERGWGPYPVRVCNKCFKGEVDAQSLQNGHVTDLTARKVGEALHSTIGTVISTFEYPLGFIKESVRPAYWVPDEDVLTCAVCHTQFLPKITKHHCRACGQGVCDACSPASRCVPSRGWDHPVRVCKLCIEKDNYS